MLVDSALHRRLLQTYSQEPSILSQATLSTTMSGGGGVQGWRVGGGGGGEGGRGIGAKVSLVFVSLEQKKHGTIRLLTLSTRYIHVRKFGPHIVMYSLLKMFTDSI